MMISNELKVCICINLLTLAFFTGGYVFTIKNLIETVKDLKKEFSKRVVEIKEDFQNKVEEIKKNYDEKVKDIKDNFKDHLDRLEKKQDKHNNLIERMTKSEKEIAVLSEKVDVGNHRISDLENLHK